MIPSKPTSPSKEIAMLNLDWKTLRKVMDFIDEQRKQAYHQGYQDGYTAGCRAH